MLTDTSYPGWKATVDGEDAPLHRVDYLFRGVQVDAGRHRVEFRYEPASWRIGVAISAGALTLLIVLTGLGLARRRASTIWGARPLTGDARAH